MGNSASKSRSKKHQKSRKMIATETKHNNHAPAVPPSTMTPDYRKPQPEQTQPQLESEEYYYTEEDADQQGVDGSHHEQINIESCIDRLLAASQHKHIGKTLCLDQTEVIAICRYAYNIFLDQPVSLLEPKRTMVSLK